MDDSQINQGNTNPNWDDSGNMADNSVPQPDFSVPGGNVNMPPEPGVNNQQQDFGQSPGGDMQPPQPDVGIPSQPDFSSPTMDNQQQDFGQNPGGDMQPPQPDVGAPSQPDFSSPTMDNQQQDFGDYMQPEQPNEQNPNMDTSIEFPNPDINDNPIEQSSSQFEANTDVAESNELPPQPQADEQANMPNVEEQFNQGTTSSPEDQKLNPLLIVGLAAGLVVILAIIIIIILLLG